MKTFAFVLANVDYFLRRETVLYSYFPANPPDAFLSLKTADGLRRFFFDVVSKDTPPSAINRRLVNYIEFFDDGSWDVTGSDLPKLLFLLENPATENRLRRAAHAVRSRFDLDDEIEIYTATIESLLGDDSAIWSNIDELGELAMVARKPPHNFRGEAYFANDRQMACFVRQRSTR